MFIHTSVPVCEWCVRACLRVSIVFCNRHLQITISETSIHPACLTTLLCLHRRRHKVVQSPFILFCSYTCLASSEFWLEAADRLLSSKLRPLSPPHLEPSQLVPPPPVLSLSSLHEIIQMCNQVFIPLTQRNNY